ncbi:MAG TPA: S41 family peptidase [Chthoniobacterales bacterium]|nr:S41 family peptidase [Chthoniobacterales bacterium]
MTIATFSRSLAAPTPASPSTVFDNVAAILRDRYYDKKFRDEQLPSLIEKYRPAAGSPSDLNSQRTVAGKLLAQVPASHLGLLSEESFQYLVAELSGQEQPTFGFQVVRMQDEYFTFFVLEEGPAAGAGVQSWERVLSIDGVPTGESRRLDWAQKDAYLPIDRDPPIHSILGQTDDEITLVLERRRGEQRTLKIKARPWSALQAARASARTMEIDGHTVGYVHFWFIHARGVPEMLRELFAGKFAEADGLILDLRGRGGNGVVVPDILEILSNWKRPIVALTDRQSRSAKDALAYEFKERHLATLVGEPTAGAVIPASFAQVGEKTMLMFPSFTLGEYTRKLELKGGVAPDVFVERAGPYSAGSDPILERGKEELARLLENAPRVTSEATPAVSVQSSAPPPAPERVPDLAEIIRKMTTALGGENALRAHSHRTLSGTAEMIGLPMKGDYVQKAGAPNRSLVVMHLGDLLVRQGFDGQVAWSDSPVTGKQIVTGPAADLIRQQAPFYGPLDFKASYREVAVVGFTMFDDKQCLELKLVGHGGTVSFLYLDAETFLAAGTKMNLPTPIGPVETKTYSRNYRDLGGFVTATEIYIESSVQRQRIIIDKVSFEEIPAEEFSPPL